MEKHWQYAMYADENKSQQNSGDISFVYKSPPDSQ